MDGEASRQNIQDVLSVEMNRHTGPNDRLLVFFAGHGQDFTAPTGRKMGYLIPVDGEPSHLMSRCISMDEIERWSELIPAKHILYAMDCCYSGLAATRHVGLDSSVEGYLARIVREPVRQVITAGQADQKVVEDSGHGLFTRVFVQGLRGEADTTGRGFITGADLAAYVKERVFEESHWRQEPLFRYLAGDGEFLLKTADTGDAPSSLNQPAAMLPVLAEGPGIEEFAADSHEALQTAVLQDSETIIEELKGAAEEAGGSEDADLGGELTGTIHGIHLLADHVENWRRGSNRGLPEADWLLGLFHLQHVRLEQRVAHELVDKHPEILFKPESVGDGTREQAMQNVESSDLQYGLEFLARAARNTYEPAEFHFGMCCLDGIGREIDRDLGSSMIRSALEKGFTPHFRFLSHSVWAIHEAARCGHVEAQYDLGARLAVGEGIVQDMEEAARWYERAAEKGHAGAQYQLGLCYRHGSGVRADDPKAAAFLQRAAEQDLSEAQYELGKCCAEGAGVVKDSAEAARWYGRAAEQDHVEAQLCLAQCYATGEGLPESQSDAAQWFQKAAEQGHVAAQYELGMCYARGRGVAEDCSEAIRWFRVAAEAGHMAAQYEVARCCATGTGVREDLPQAVQWYHKAAEQGYPLAEYELGRCYDKGIGVDEDFAEAAAWYRRAAEQGCPSAEYELGRCYAEGKGVEKDASRATRWFTKAADHDHPSAIFELGVCYATGEGVQEDLDRAVHLYHSAAEKNCLDAQWELGQCYATGRAVTTDYVQAARWFSRAAVQGYVAAEYEVGCCCANGKGLPESQSDAAQWFQKAAEQGHVAAQYELGMCYARGRGVAEDCSEAIRWFRVAAEAGHMAAQYEMGLWARDSYKDYSQALKWFRKAADQGHPDSQYEVARSYSDGRGVVTDASEALRYLCMASEQGHPKAKYDLGVGILTRLRGLHSPAIDTVLETELAGRQPKSVATGMLQELLAEQHPSAEALLRKQWSSVEQAAESLCDTGDPGPWLDAVGQYRQCWPSIPHAKELNVLEKQMREELPPSLEKRAKKYLARHNFDACEQDVSAIASLEPAATCLTSMRARLSHLRTKTEAWAVQDPALGWRAVKEALAARHPQDDKNMESYRNAMKRWRTFPLILVLIAFVVLLCWTVSFALYHGHVKNLPYTQYDPEDYLSSIPKYDVDTERYGFLWLKQREIKIYLGHTERLRRATEIADDKHNRDVARREEKLLKTKAVGIPGIVVLLLVFCAACTLWFPRIRISARPPASRVFAWASATESLVFWKHAGAMLDKAPAVTTGSRAYRKQLDMLLGIREKISELEAPIPLPPGDGEVQEDEFLGARSVFDRLKRLPLSD